MAALGPFNIALTTESTPVVNESLAVSLLTPLTALSISSFFLIKVSQLPVDFAILYSASNSKA